MKTSSFFSPIIHWRRLWPCLLLLCWLSLDQVHGQVPQLVNYQGRVAVGSVNFTGTGAFKFALVNTNGSTTYWSNDGTSTAGSQPTAAVSLTVTNGLYSVLLGDTTRTNMTAIPASVWTNADVRLRVWFNDGTNGFQLLSPDQRFAPNGYLPDSAVTSAKLAPGSVGNLQLALGAVQGNNIADNAIGSLQLANGAVESSNIQGGAVGTTQLAPGALSVPLFVGGTSQSTATNTNYTATNSGLTTFTLPATATVGDTVQISGTGIGG